MGLWRITPVLNYSRRKKAFARDIRPEKTRRSNHSF